MDYVDVTELSPAQKIIYELMVEKNYSKFRIGKEAAIERRTINNIISGETTEPRPDVFKRLLGLYVSVCYLSKNEETI